MSHIILETIIDSIKLLPFLFLSYLLIEFIEHKSSKSLEKILKNSGKFGSIIGAILGLLPQCGFSVTASNFYASRVITVGTLIAVFLSTSDEAIPVLLSHPGSTLEIIKILIFKFIIGMFAGLVIDFIFRKRHSLKEDVKEVHEHMHEMYSHCDCEHEHGILKPTLKHTFSIFTFILIVSFILNTTVHLIGEDRLYILLMNGSIFQPLIAGLIGLIPNCASSVLLTELYLAGSISFGSIIAGLCTGAGIGIVVLFKVNHNLKQNLKILGCVYAIGSISGIIIELVSLIW